jgi:hypothetical protein
MPFLRRIAMNHLRTRAMHGAGSKFIESYLTWPRFRPGFARPIPEATNLMMRP